MRKRVKVYLDSQPGWCTTTNVADALGITTSNARRTLRDLHKQGVVQKGNVDHHVVSWSSVKEADMVDRGRNGKGAAVYTEHMNVKLTPEQAAAIRASGKPDSTWIREAVEHRLKHERTGEPAAYSRVKIDGRYVN